MQLTGSSLLLVMPVKTYCDYDDDNGEFAGEWRQQN